jgi:DNA repair exonuclease SbcCD nuclease subunit
LTTENANSSIGNKNDKWLIVAYDVPYEPSKFRVKVWRDLKSQGGLYPQMSFCILPYSTKTVSKIEEVKTEIENVGKMLLLQTEEITESDNRHLHELMSEQSQRQYLEILEEGQEFLDEVKSNRRNNIYREEEIKELDESLEGLRKWFDKTFSVDRQKTSLARSKVKEMLVRCQKHLDKYAAEVEIRESRKLGTLEQKTPTSQRIVRELE